MNALGGQRLHLSISRSVSPLATRSSQVRCPSARRLSSRTTLPRIDGVSATDHSVIALFWDPEGRESSSSSSLEPSVTSSKVNSIDKKLLLPQNLALDIVLCPNCSLWVPNNQTGATFLSVLTLRRLHIHGVPYLCRLGSQQAR